MRSVLAFAAVLALALIVQTEPAHAGNGFASAGGSSTSFATPAKFSRSEARRPVAGVGKHGRKGRHGARRRVVPILVERDRDDRRPRASPPNTTVILVVDARDPLSLHRYAWGWVSRCEARYSTFDARSGTFVDPDGTRRRCE